MDQNNKSSRGRQSSQNQKSKAGDFKDRRKTAGSKPFKKTVKVDAKKVETTKTGIRLNKYISNAGICSRREADVFIGSGSAKVNGKIVTEMGYRVQETDEVRFDGTLISPETKRYVLLNKPKNYITTMEDERGRKTVMDLVEKASKERIYPVGRLDRNTTGLLLFTNDGELAKKLTHPKHNVRKLYHASLDRKLDLKDLQAIGDPGFQVEGRRVFVDAISYVEGATKKEIGIEIHSGRNRIVRKIFESLGYNVVKLDRVIFAGMTKKNLPRGFFRHLTQQEINTLKMI
jgi:23S rRNA pseudouridine2605 synthase